MGIDLNFKGKDYESNLKLIKEANKYGWQHINFSYAPDEYNNALKFKKELEEEFSIDYTLEIDSNNPNDLRKLVNKFRNKTNCITVIGGDLKINRAVCENIKIDVLSRPYLKRYDSGLNQVLSKLAVENNVAIELSFKDILNSYLSGRSKILSNFRDIYTLYRKFKFPLIITLNAKSVFDIRSVRDIQAFLKSTGLSNEEITEIFNYPQNILDLNKNRQNLILKGVKRV